MSGVETVNCPYCGDRTDICADDIDGEYSVDECNVCDRRFYWESDVTVEISIFKIRGQGSESE